MSDIFGHGFSTSESFIPEQADSPSSIERFSDQSYAPSAGSSPDPTGIEMDHNYEFEAHDHGYQSSHPPYHFSYPSGGDGATENAPTAHETLEQHNELLMSSLERISLPHSPKGKGARKGAAEYKCLWEGCAKRVKRRDHAKAHVAAHYGLKPFACPHW